MSSFEEKSGSVNCATPWGSWYQTIDEVFLEVNLPAGTRGADLVVTIKAKSLLCAFKGQQQSPIVSVR